MKGEQGCRQECRRLDAQPAREGIRRKARQAIRCNATPCSAKILANDRHEIDQRHGHPERERDVA